MTALPNLDGLIALARQDGVDIRPTLLRVLTDLYVQKDAHTRGEEDHFTELALSLLAGLDVPTRAAIAKKLAPYAQAPQAVLERLARDVIEVAEPILSQSPRLSGDDLVAIIRTCGPEHAAAIAGRRNGTAPRQEPIAAAEPMHVLPLTRADLSAPATGHELGLVAGGERETSELAPVELETRDGGSVALGDYFFSAAASERRLLLANLDDGTPRTEQAPVTKTQDTIPGLETAALQQRPDDFARALETALAVPAAIAQKIVADQTGEPVAVAAKALGVPSDVFLRIILFLNPAIGHSVERVFALVDLYDQLSAQAALQVVSSWQDVPATATSERKAPRRHQPLLWDDERRGARRTFAEHGRRFPLQLPASDFGQQKPIIRKKIIGYADL